MTTLRLEPPSVSAPLAPPPPRGRLLTAEQVATDLLAGAHSPAWVRRHVRPKLALGHSTVRFYETDVVAWIEQQRTP